MHGQQNIKKNLYHTIRRYITKTLKPERFYHPESNSGHSHYEVVQCYILYSESPMKRSDQNYIVPHNGCVCVCVGGGGGRRHATEGKEFAKPANRHKTTSMQDQFPSAPRPSTFLWWTSMRTDLYLDRHTWKLRLWCSGLLSDCTILFCPPCFAMNHRTPYNFDTTTNQEITLLF